MYADDTQVYLSTPACDHVNATEPVMWCLEAVPCLEAASRQIFTALALASVLEVSVLVLVLSRDCKSVCTTPASLVSCSRGCKPSRTPLPISSLGPEDLNMWHRYCMNCIGYQYGRVFCSRRPCWCTSVGMVWLHLTCWHTASQCHLVMIDVIFALPSLDNFLFHTWQQTTVAAASLLAVRSCGTVCQLHLHVTVHIS